MKTATELQQEIDQLKGEIGELKTKEDEFLAGLAELEAKEKQARDDLGWHVVSHGSRNSGGRATLQAEQDASDCRLAIQTLKKRRQALAEQAADVESQRCQSIKNYWADQEVLLVLAVRDAEQKGNIKEIESARQARTNQIGAFAEAMEAVADFESRGGRERFIAELVGTTAPAPGPALPLRSEMTPEQQYARAAKWLPQPSVN